MNRLFSDQSCEACRYWLRGDCHLRGPKAYVGDGQAITLWPSTEADDWCGDFKWPPEQQQPRVLRAIPK